MQSSATPQFADVTVIIPAYRAEATIGRALQSVASQTLLPRAVVVVDDGSPDSTQAAAESWRNRMNGVALSVVRQENAGAGAARNRAIAEARSTWLAFLDADDEWLPEKIDRSMARITATGAILVAHDSYEIDGATQTRLDCARRFAAAKEAPFPGLYRRGFIDTSTVVARRDAVVAAGGFDTTLANGQDFELWLAVLQNPEARFVVFDEALSRYHITPGSIMSHIERRRDCCMTIAERYAPALRHHPGSPLASLWFRIVAIHYEAANAHRAKGDRRAALLSLLRLAVSLITATGHYLIGRRPARHPGLA